MSAKIHIERMMYRSSIAVPGESAASYALVKLIPSADGAGKPVALNLALVLDVSGSMYEEDGTGISRLKRIQQAALSALEKLKPEDTLAIIAFAHNCQVIHRDLKPLNIIIGDFGETYVLDWGLAKHLEGTSALTQTGAIVGTPSYMAPEQACGTKTLTTAADIHSL